MVFSLNFLTYIVVDLGIGEEVIYQILWGNLSLGHASKEGAYRNLGAHLRRAYDIIRIDK